MLHLNWLLNSKHLGHIAPADAENPGFGLQNLPEFIDAVEKSCGLEVRGYSRAVDRPAMFGDFTHVNRRGSATSWGLMFTWPSNMAFLVPCGCCC